jgi:hypothetical protein
MRQAHPNDPKGGEVQTETGEPLKGPKPLNLDKDRSRVLSESSPGEDRTPDKRIGQVAHADGQGTSRHGGAGEPETSPLEPEKQGGIGGP